jgi:hypothetical protein
MSHTRSASDRRPKREDIPQIDDRTCDRDEAHRGKLHTETGLGIVDGGKTTTLNIILNPEGLTFRTQPSRVVSLSRARPARHRDLDDDIISTLPVKGLSENWPNVGSENHSSLSVPSHCCSPLHR